MQAADPPAIVAPSEETGMIEVVGTRRDHAQKIDRRIYRVRQNAQSAQADSLQLLRGLPAVIITPDDQILLLGSGGVAIMVDERPIQGDKTQFLRTLRGSDIERIEIITNPSAQYSSQGTGGIINFVLRRKQGEGLSGSGSAQLSSIGNGDSSGTLKLKRGDWTTELQAQGQSGRTSRSTYHKVRTVQESPGAAPTINREQGGGSSNRTTGFLSGKLTFEIDPKTSVSGQIDGGGSRSRSTNDAEFLALTPDFDPFSERQRFNVEETFAGAQLTLDHKGKKDGETLKASAQLYGNPTERQSIAGDFDDGSGYTSRRESRRLYTNVQVDWSRPIGKNAILSTGAKWGRSNSNREYAFASTDSDGAFGPDAADQFEAEESIVTAYATFQRRIGSWTIMPGLRMERFGRDITSRGRPSVEISRTSLFPTFHLERPLGKAVTLTASYSKRIDRPDADQLRPYPVFLGGLAIGQGNPALRDQTTDAYELNLRFRRKKLDAGVIIFDRETDRLWENSYFVNDEGFNVVTTVNSGRKTDRGAQFDVTTPLLRRVKAMASVNLFSSNVPIDPLVSDEREETFRYTGNATLEWQGAAKGKRPGDIALVQLVYESPSRSFQLRYDARYSINFSWTHSFSPTVSVTGSVNGIGPVHYRHRLLAPLVQETYDKRERLPEFKLKLVKTLGNGN